MPLAAGTRLGPYEVLASLGRGGMGEVYRARDTRLMRDVAIKALPTEFARDPERLTRFRREAQTLAGLNHPNIAAIYGLEEADGAPHLVLELVDGETLVTKLEKGPVSPRDALTLGIQIASAIEAAHERGIVHRDLKPGNVMVTASGTAKVLDFGLAKSDAGPGRSGASTMAHATEEGMILGTAAYMSPEQARGKPVDRRSDVWSFGCVLFECYAGRPAFTGETASDLVARILEREPDWSALPQATPPRVRELLRRCLRKNVDDRPRDIRDVRLELTDIAAGGGRGSASHEKSIAVLPFENQSGPDDEYFADGVTDEILNALAQVEGLRVAARTSCFAFKGKREDLRSIGEKLDVATLLEGTVRRAGPKLRITTQLVNAADGYQLWSERYDREMTDVFAVQDEIAGAIAARLRVAMQKDSEKTRGTKNLEAYELVLRGRAFQVRRGRFMAQAAACFEKAIALDPDYAEPLAWLSDFHRLSGTFGETNIGEAMAKARSLGERALAIDPDQAHAWSTLASIAEQYDRDYPRSDELYAKAMRLEPRNATTRAQWAVWRIVRSAMTDDVALAELRQAVQDDPLNSWVEGMYSFGLAIAGRHEEAIAEARRAMELDPESFFARWSLMRSLAWAGEFEEAFQVAPSALMESGRHVWALGLLGWSYARAGRPAEARACYDELEARSRHGFVSPAWLSVAACAAGLPEESLRHLERAVAEREPTVLWSRRFPLWDSLRSDPRFEEVTRPLWTAATSPVV